MGNDRNAGRKPLITPERMEDIIIRNKAGESVANLAREYKVSRQALYKRIREYSYIPARVEYMVDGMLCTLIEVDFRRERLHVVNYAAELSKRAFGYITNPDWEDFKDFIEKYYLEAVGAGPEGTKLLRDGKKGFALDEIPKDSGERRLNIEIESESDVPVFRFKKGEIIITRSDTDGFQMKAISSDRRYFIKSQAVMAGVKLNDWAVEITSAHICEQLGINCIRQNHCRFVYGGREYDGVYSDNFELDGYTFLSFEGILERMHRSSNEDEFIRFDAISKLKWCASRLCEASGIQYEETVRYMIDLAVLDCLIGNIDRHTRNFGLFYNACTGKYSIPPAFDNGMGLFENDSYRDEYKTFDEAMDHVYVSPYGEDPFDMLKLLDEHFGLRSVYGSIKRLDYGAWLQTEYALEYEERMNELWQKSG
ncbi:MAG: HipA domain-containing protein [Lachnospiraceae bacterium]|nr:HipA domain-containing protein [Lachnospiraceae bacterium]